MSSKKKVILNLVILVILSTVMQIFSMTRIGSFTHPEEKLKLQEETIKLLDRLDGLPNSFKNINALFSDQSEENICKYVDLYKEIVDILKELDKYLKEWNTLIAQDEYEKIYRAYAAAIQIAQYTIYSKPARYLSFLNVYKKKQNILKPEYKIQNDDLLNYKDSSEEWEIKADEILAHANVNIEKALAVDPLYEDAKILKTQILALESGFEDAMESFNVMEKKGFFKDKGSLLNSWRAFIELEKGNHSMAQGLMVKAYSFPAPIQNSNWARNYRNHLKNSKTKWIIHEPYWFEEVDNIDLEELKHKTKEAVNNIRFILSKLLSHIPDQPTKSKLDQLTKKPTLGIIFTLDTDYSEGNLNHYINMLKDFYQVGDKLIKIIEDWNKLAKKNRETAYYFLISKSSCSFVLLHMINATKSIIGNKHLNKRLQRLHQKEINIAKKWNEWEKQIVNSLGNDIRQTLSQQSDLIYAHILSFEYDALFSSPGKALKRLENLSKKFEVKKMKKMPTYYSKGIDINGYIASWKAYLEIKKGDLKAAEKSLEKAATSTGVREWANNQKKLLKLRSINQAKN